MEVKLYELGAVEDALFKVALIACRYRGQWVFAQQRGRTTWQIPGGKREPGEAILQTARRELFEETGALTFELFPVCTYFVTRYALLCYGEIEALGELPPSEIERIGLFDRLPEYLAYPDLHPVLFEKVCQWLAQR